MYEFLDALLTCQTAPEEVLCRKTWVLCSADKSLGTTNVNLL